MIIRIAYFHELSPVGREWITAAVEGVPGMRGAYHAAPPNGPGYISVAIADDEEAMERSGRAIAARREKLGIASQGPDQVSLYIVNDYVENR